MIPPVVDLSLVIPAYNEAAGITPSLEEVVAALTDAGIDHEVVVVDDGSTDGTAERIEELAERLPGVRVVRHGTNRGYGAALKTGIRAATADVIAITDADGTYPADRLPGLYRRLVDEGADMVVGSRTGADVHIPAIRRPAKAFMRLLANYITGRRIPDLNSGLRVFRRAPVEERFNLISDGFSFTTTVTLALLVRHRIVAYEPIDYHERTGSSKIRPIADTLNFLVLMLRACVYFEPLKVFLPVTGGLAVVGVLWGARQISQMGGIGDAPVLFLLAALQVLLVGLIADMISRRN